MQSRDVAKLFEVSTETVRRWENRGLLRARRLPSGHRRFDAADVLRLREMLARRDIRLNRQ